MEAGCRPKIKARLGQSRDLGLRRQVQAWSKVRVGHRLGRGRNWTKGGLEA